MSKIIVDPALSELNYTSSLTPVRTQNNETERLPLSPRRSHSRPNTGPHLLHNNTKPYINRMLPSLNSHHPWRSTDSHHLRDDTKSNPAATDIPPLTEGAISGCIDAAKSRPSTAHNNHIKHNPDLALALVRIRLTYDGIHIATGTVRADLPIHMIITTLGGRRLLRLPTTTYPMLNNIKPLRDTNKISDYVGHPQHDHNDTPTHNIDLRPTIRGGGHNTGEPPLSTNAMTAEPAEAKTTNEDGPDLQRTMAGSQGSQPDLGHDLSEPGSSHDTDTQDGPPRCKPCHRSRSRPPG